MQNLDKKQQVLAKIVSVPGFGKLDCALMRLARANGATRSEAYVDYPRRAMADGLTMSQLWAMAYGWDAAVGHTPILSEIFLLDPDYPEWLALGAAAALACGEVKVPTTQVTPGHVA